MAEFPGSDSSSSYGEGDGDGGNGTGAPEVRFGASHNYCSWGMRPHVMTGFLVQLLRQHFADRQSVEDPALRGTADDPREDFLWKVEDPRGMMIEPITNWDPDLAQHTPGVVVRRNAWSNVPTGINSEHQGMYAADGYQRFSFFWQGSHTLFCRSAAPAEAERLAAEVYRELQDFGPQIREYLNLKKWGVSEVDRLYRVKAAGGDEYAVPVTVGYATEEQVIVRKHAPKLKRISLLTMTQ